MDNPDCWPEIGLKELAPSKSASVYECIRFIWPYNAHPELFNHSPDLGH